MNKRKRGSVNYEDVSSDEEDSKPNNEKAIDVDTGDDISEYEKLRLRNIAEREMLMKSLGFDQAIEELREILPSTNPLKKKRHKPRMKIKHEDLPTREPSRRIRKMPVFFQSSMNEVNEVVAEEVEESKDDRLLGSKPMTAEESQSNELLLRLKDIQTDIEPDTEMNVNTCDITNLQNIMFSFKMTPGSPTKVVSSRIQSLLTHPTVAKKLIAVGSVSGELGLLDLGTNAVVNFHPHQGPVNCISASLTNIAKLYTTSHDGTLLCADLEKHEFSNIYATNYSDKIKHLTWHDQVDSNTVLLAHGDGSVGVVDLRDPKAVERWIPCYERSARTVQHHPIQDNYFLVSSGQGSGCKVFDLRTCTNQSAEQICEMRHPKSLTSAFFSLSGNHVLTTCNSDCLRIYQSPLSSSPSIEAEIPHNNHTGRWLSVFKAMWFPGRDDTFFIGSLMADRQIQIYNKSGQLISLLKSPRMTTINSVISMHPSLPLIAGGNSSGRVHAFVYK